MTPILEMRSFVCVILMSVQFVVACAAIYTTQRNLFFIKSGCGNRFQRL